MLSRFVPERRHPLVFDQRDGAGGAGGEILCDVVQMLADLLEVLAVFAVGEHGLFARCHVLRTVRGAIHSSVAEPDKRRGYRAKPLALLIRQAGCVAWHPRAIILLCD